MFYHKNQILYSDLSRALQKRMTENPLYTNLSGTIIMAESVINSKTRELNALNSYKELNIQSTPRPSRARSA